MRRPTFRSGAEDYFFFSKGLSLSMGEDFNNQQSEHVSQWQPVKSLVLSPKTSRWVIGTALTLISKPVDSGRFPPFPVTVESFSEPGGESESSRNAASFSSARGNGLKAANVQE